MAFGIAAINVYGGRACLEVRQLFAARGLDTHRFDNLMMDAKSVNLPCEDPVTNAVNAAMPLVRQLSTADRARIEAVVVGTESGLDLGKPISTYVQDHLGLPRRCRSFEVKHACYGGTAALQAAVGLLATSPVPGAMALVVAADAACLADKDTYWEPSQGAGAVAMLVGSQPDVLELDQGANGFYSYEVMDTFRPRPDLEEGDSDLSLMSYLHCLENSYDMYAERVAGCDLLDTFDYLAFHTPFAGMVKGAHRTLARRRLGLDAERTEADFQTRLAPSLVFSSRVGNVYSASLYLALCSLVEHADFSEKRRVGLFSYGSGCASEFYSGVVAERAPAIVAAMGISAALDSRYGLDMDEYETVNDLAVTRLGGVRNATFDPEPYAAAYEKGFAGQGLLVLDRITNFHREYRWS